MIRLSTCVSVLLACGSGLYLYQTKHQAQVLDRQIEHTVKAIAATRMQTRELVASWTLLGSPDRLQQLSDQFLGIKPVQPSQFVAMSDLDSRLPAPRALDAPSPPGPATDAPSPGDTVSDMIPVAATGPAGAPDTPTTPAPTAHAVAAAAPAPSSPAQATETGKAQAVAATRPADRKSGETPRPGHEMAQTHPIAPRPANPPAPVVAELDGPARAAPQRLAPAPQRVAPAPITGSLLGMAHVAVAPPLPLAVSTAPSTANGN